MTKPITPADVENIKAERMRPEMIDAANELIAEHWNGYSACFTLNELCARARAKLNMEAGASFKNGELDIEVVFRKHGWKVEFDKPGFNETYSANWTFTKKKD